MTEKTDEYTIVANEYSFCITGGRVKAAVTGLHLRRPGEDPKNELRTRLVVKVPPDVSNKQIIEILKLMIRNIEGDGLPNPWHEIARGEAAAMMMWEASNKILEAAQAIVEHHNISLLEDNEASE